MNISPDTKARSSVAERLTTDTNLHTIGNREILACPSLALLCSTRAPAGILLAVHDLAQAWRRTGPVIMSGFQAPVEDEALTVLLRGPQPVVLWLARGLYRRVPARLRPALDDGRLLIVSGFAETVRRPCRETAQRRNREVVEAADALLVAHAEVGSRTFLLAQARLSAGETVYALDHNANELLLQAGAKVYAPNRDLGSFDNTTMGELNAS